MQLGGHGLKVGLAPQLYLKNMLEKSTFQISKGESLTNRPSRSTPVSGRSEDAVLAWRCCSILLASATSYTYICI